MPPLDDYAEIEQRVLRRSAPGGPPDDPWRPVGVGVSGRGGGGTLVTCKILSAAGTTPPFLYSAEQVAHDGGGNFGPDYWDAVPGGLVLTGNLINVAEVAPQGAGVAALEEGSIVQVFAIAGGRYACDTSWYRGTY